MSDRARGYLVLLLSIPGLFGLPGIILFKVLEPSGYLIECREDGRLAGGTGLAFETPFRAATGYVLARDAWGRGYATEALAAIVPIAAETGVRRLYALCHTEHQASSRVLEKCGFTREGMLRRHSEFPNLRPGVPADVFSYARVFE